MGYDFTVKTHFFGSLIFTEARSIQVSVFEKVAEDDFPSKSINKTY